MNWSPGQQAMLSVMGYTLYRQAGPAMATPEPAAALPAPPLLATDRLMQALMRAAGGHDPSALPLPSLDQLRASAAAKRALWPALRALRRQR